MTGQQLLLESPSSGFRLVSKDLPSPAEGEVLVRITLATLCGSDLHTLAGRRSAPTPCVLGHEAVGVIVASKKEGLTEGQRVTWSLASSCGSCQACKEWNLPQKCARLLKYGHSREDTHPWSGCYASHILLRPGTTILPLPPLLPDRLAAPANCAFATITHATEQLPAPCRRALVIGGGLLGLFAILALRERGVEEIYVSDPDEQRVAMARRCGALPLPQEATELRFDFALEAAGVAAAISPALPLLRPGAHFVWTGLVHDQCHFQLDGSLIVRGNLRVQGIHNYAPRHLEQALRILQTVDTSVLEDLIAAPVPLAHFEQALELAQSGQWARVSVEPNPASPS
ncbi:MAG: alcohol dehydrogenase catalytic domain-containing protein [Verrucomicrobiota bacterium JB023]|nr:alcohol dehydrogenase catalytic domain-containing protein [Verrucomicrobiota bacterium JB023]